MANLFWVGGTGNWDGTTNHFATSSGGTATVANSVSTDNVTFDANSGGGTVTITAASVTMATWTSGAHTGTINTNGKGVTVSGIMSISGTGTRTVTLGASSLTVGTWTATTTTNLTFNSNTSAIVQNANATVFNGGGLTYNSVQFTGGSNQMSGTNTMANLTLTGLANKNDSFKFNAGQTITGFFIPQGNSVTNRLLICSGTYGTAQTITLNGSFFAAQHFDMRDITGAGSNAWSIASITGNSGDCGGNSGITFTSPTTQTWSGTSGGNWSANAWTTHVPLPQDTALISSTFTASQTVTADMPRLAKTIDWSSSATAVTWDFSALPNEIYGSVTLKSNVTITGTSQNLYFMGRAGNETITCSSATWSQPIIIRNGTALYTLGDTFSSTNSFTVGNGFEGGKFSNGNFNMTCLTFNGAFGATTTHGTATITCTSTASGNIYVQTATFNTVSAASSTIVVSNTSANSRTFAGGSYIYGTLTYTVAGSTGALAVTGSNNFSTINFSDSSNARTLTFTAGTNNYIGLFNAFGTSGKVMTVKSDTAASAAILTSQLKWLMGTNSTNVSGNTGLTFGGNYQMDWLSVQDITGVTLSSLASQGVD